jgi:hypothetical protein
LLSYKYPATGGGHIASFANAKMTPGPPVERAGRIESFPEQPHSPLAQAKMEIGDCPQTCAILLLIFEENIRKIRL